jgi:predicted Zn-dependent peptidase
MLASAGLGVEYLRDFPNQLQRVTLEDAHAAAATYLTPKNLTTVVVGDGAVIADAVSTLVEVERA